VHEVLNLEHDHLEATGNHAVIDRISLSPLSPCCSKDDT
jgi:hypothetical protein